MDLFIDEVSYGFWFRQKLDLNAFCTVHSQIRTGPNRTLGFKFIVQSLISINPNGINVKKVPFHHKNLFRNHFWNPGMLSGLHKLYAQTLGTSLGTMSISTKPPFLGPKTFWEISKTRTLVGPKIFFWNPGT